MAKPKHIDLTEDGVVTQMALLAYAEGRLSDPERQEMEKLLKNDPFAQEALEGLRKTKDQREVHAVISHINTQLRERTGARERKKKGIVIHWTVYAYAAVILGLLLGIGIVMIYILPNMHQQLAVKNTPQAQESKPVIEEKKTEPPPIDSTQLLAQQKSDSTNAPHKDSLANGGTKLVAEAAPSSVAAQTPADAPSTKGEVSKEKSRDDHDKYAVSAALKSNAVASYSVTSDETTAALNAAKAYFETADYANAEKKYNEVLASQPNNPDALYFGGICSYLDNSKGLGEANFDKLAKTNMYTEGVKWYKANILIRKGQKEAAKQLLRDLINSNSSFKDRAIKEYEEMYK